MKVTPTAVQRSCLSNRRGLATSWDFLGNFQLIKNLTKTLAVMPDLCMTTKVAAPKAYLAHCTLNKPPQGNLMRGVVFDIMVDIRKSSVTFGKLAGEALTKASQRQVRIPRILRMDF